VADVYVSSMHVHLKSVASYKCHPGEMNTVDLVIQGVF